MSNINADIAAWMADASDAEVLEFMSFRSIAETCWKVPTKNQGWQPFIFNPAQVILDREFLRQMDTRGFVRMNALKCRQVTCTTYWTRRLLRETMDHEAWTALTIAHRREEPTKWLKRCRVNIDQTPSVLRPKSQTTQGHLLAFENGSSYGIGSTAGDFPGMGDTVQALHLSEVGRWDKPPISKDPDELLTAIMPAVPTGANIKGTVVARESTGVMVGDWWNRTWLDGKAKDSDYVNIFLPWFLVPEYRENDPGEILSLNPYEHELVRIAKTHDIDLTHAQLAWRRWMLRTEWRGKELDFAAEYPATEDEAFMTAGLPQYQGEMVPNARKTQREPIWRGNILADPETNNPARARFEPNPSGEVAIWEWPDARYHYVLGSDSMWGRRAKGTDFDAMYVERLEWDAAAQRWPLCAEVYGKWPLSHWGWIHMALGYKFNTCPVAPEITGQETQEGVGVLAVLLGETTKSEYRYPNIWVRSKKTTLRPRVEDYGWNTDYHTKRLLLGMSQQASLDNLLDWCSERAIDQMATIICTETGALEAPAGLHDDCWVARVITAEVARRERLVTDLYIEPAPAVMAMRTGEQRMIESDERFRREAYDIPDDESVEDY